ncbi:MAG TPA: phosphopantetheine-binding protein [Candidatus Polarisedimenticolia bacterium]|nr:phosphopantetheine-binding protein [Candidatus Polarisedimenticolia bacterium]
MAQSESAANESLKREIKELIVSQLRLPGVTPEGIGDDESLAHGALGLDSIDFLELTVAMEKRYGVKITQVEEATRIFASVTSLAGHISRHRASAAGV